MASDEEERPDAGVGARRPALPSPRGGAAHKGRRLVKPQEKDDRFFSPEERLMILDLWRRSGLPAGDFAPLVGASTYTLYRWQRKFEAHGPAGLMDQARGGPKGSRVPEVTKRAILMLKESNPDMGCQTISDMLVRGPALPASPGAVARVLKEAGYVFEEVRTHPHPDKPREFERARPNQLWQTDLFTFVLKRQNRRVYLVVYLDDHARFIVSYGLWATQSSALVLEALRAGIASYGAPAEVLTDNGSQYVTWRGKSAFTKECEKLGIKQIVATPRRPQTLGKVERFWGSLWRECLESAIFIDLADAQMRIGLYIDHYNFRRPHQGIGGLVPADRYFQAAPEVLRTLKERVAANAAEIARHGMPKEPFYLTGKVGGTPFSVHAEGERVILTRRDGTRQEVDLVPPESGSARESMPAPLCPQGQVTSSLSGDGNEEPAAPGVSVLDGAFDGEEADGEEAIDDDAGHIDESAQ
ncbi:MAG: DDE-type integrase/transposase/recombinase [Polyangiaceae bacterium]|nr:DDE-type integrase/transposase/recombinase [Polyangiaceae bacterium]